MEMVRVGVEMVRVEMVGVEMVRAEEWDPSTSGSHVRRRKDTALRPCF